MKILHVCCSPRGQAAESARLSRKIVGLLLGQYPEAQVVDRAVGDGSVPHVDESYAISQHSAADASQDGTAAKSAELIRELDSADIVVIGTPMHNYTVPSALKAWIDHVVRVRWTFNIGPQGKVGLLRDRPVYVAVSSGGKFSGDGPHQPDFLTPYMKTIFGMIGLHDLTFFSVQGSAFGTEAVAAARMKTDQALQEHFSQKKKPSPPHRDLRAPSPEFEHAPAKVRVNTPGIGRNWPAHALITDPAHHEMHALFHNNLSNNPLARHTRAFHMAWEEQHERMARRLRAQAAVTAAETLFDDPRRLAANLDKHVAQVRSVLCETALG
jgi:FMN-dependent NADH-azoreductase